MHATRLLSNKIRNQVYLRCTVHGYFIQDEQIGLEHFLLSEYIILTDPKNSTHFPQVFGTQKRRSKK